MRARYLPGQGRENSICYLIGFNEGLEVVEQTFHSLREINLNGRWQEILSKGLESYVAKFSITKEQISYTFITPWLALNDGNYKKYRQLDRWMQKKEFLEKILVGNIISISKSLGYTVPEPIKAHIKHLAEIKTSLKRIQMIGFKGNFMVNFEIPDYWGIGKSVSRGFGTLVKDKNAVTK